MESQNLQLQRKIAFSSIFKEFKTSWKRGRQQKCVKKYNTKFSIWEAATRSSNFIKRVLNTECWVTFKLNFNSQLNSFDYIVDQVSISANEWRSLDKKSYFLILSDCLVNCCYQSFLPVWQSENFAIMELAETRKNMFHV
jgi:hypothetical protein